MKAKTCVVFNVLAVLALILGVSAARPAAAALSAAPQPPEGPTLIEADGRSSPLDPGPFPARGPARKPEAVTPAQEASRMALIGQIGGMTQAIAVQGNYVYLGVGPRVVVLDISNPTTPTLVGRSPVLPGVVNRLRVAGNYVYVASRQGGLRILSVADPARPVEVGFYDTPGYALDVAVVGSHAFVADGTYWTGGQSVNSGLRIINVADPTRPVEVGRCATVGNPSAVVVAGSYAYVGDDGIWDYSQSQWVGGGLRVINIADLSNPLLVGNLGIGRIVAVAASGNHIFTGGDYRKVTTVEVSDPMHPAVTSTYWAYDEISDLDVQDSRLYIAAGWSGGLEIVNVSDPANPIYLQRLQTQGKVKGVTVADGKAYVASDYDGTLWIVDVANPAQANVVGTYAAGDWARDLTLVGSRVYIASGTGELNVADLENPANPKYIGSVRFGSTYMGPDRLAVSGDFAYVAFSYRGVQIINIADPANPALAGFYDSPGEAKSIAVAGSYAYLADGTAGLRIVNVANPTAPVEVGFFDTPGQAYGVAVVGSRAFVADGGSGLRILDVSNPALPSELGFYDTPGQAIAVSVVGDYAYIADGNRLVIVDVRDATAPNEVSQVSSCATDVAITGSYAFAACEYGGRVSMFDISNPAAPTEVGFYITGGYCDAVEAAGNLVFVADGWRGLLVLRYLDKALYLPLIVRN